MINCRIFPGVDPNAIKDELAKITGAQVTVTRNDDYVASLASPLRPDVFTLMPVAASNSGSILIAAL